MRTEEIKELAENYADELTGEGDYFEECEKAFICGATKYADKLFVEERQNEMLIQELHNKDKEIEHLREESKIAEYNNLFALFKKGYVLALPVNSCVDINELRVKFDEICTELAFYFK